MATSTPWTINNFHENLRSPDKQYKIIVKTCRQFEMGSPWQVDYYLKDEANGREIFISDLAGAPLLWNQNSNFFVFTKWFQKQLNKIESYWYQRLCLVDVNNLEKITFKEHFNVLQLERFNNYVVKGYDTSTDESFSFNVFSNEVYKTEKLIV